MLAKLSIVAIAACAPITVRMAHDQEFPHQIGTPPSSTGSSGYGDIVAAADLFWYSCELVGKPAPELRAPIIRFVHRTIFPMLHIDPSSHVAPGPTAST